MESMKRLWTHEVLRVYYDRLVDDGDRKWLVEALDKCMSQEFNTDFNVLFKHLDSNADGNDSWVGILIFWFSLFPLF